MDAVSGPTIGAGPGDADPLGDAASATSLVDSPRQRPRLREVADATGLSMKTVSRALRGEANVRASTRELVVTEAERIGFRLDDVAAGLRRKTQQMTTIGVMLGDFSNQFFAPMLQGIHSVASEHGHLVLTADAQNDPEVERRTLHAFFSQRIAGLIIAPTGDDLRYLRDEVAFGTAVVFVDAPPPWPGASIDSVTVTNEQSTREGIAHLLGNGHRRIAYLGHPRGGSGAEGRWRGYTAALADAGLEPDPALVRHGLLTEAGATAAADEIIADAAPDAFFVDNNRLAVGLLRSRRFIDHRVEVVSFDRFLLDAEFGFSVIDSDPYEVGRQGARLLFERLADRGRPPQRTEVPARFIRHSDPTY